MDLKFLTVYQKYKKENPERTRSLCERQKSKGLGSVLSDRNRGLAKEEPVVAADETFQPVHTGFTNPAVPTHRAGLLLTLEGTLVSSNQIHLVLTDDLVKV